MTGQLMDWRAAALLGAIAGMLAISNAFSGHDWSSGFCGGLAAAMATIAVISYGHHRTEVMNGEAGTHPPGDGESS